MRNCGVTRKWKINIILWLGRMLAIAKRGNKCIRSASFECHSKEITSISTWYFSRCFYLSLASRNKRKCHERRRNKNQNLSRIPSNIWWIRIEMNVSRTFFFVFPFHMAQIIKALRDAARAGFIRDENFSHLKSIFGKKKKKSWRGKIWERKTSRILMLICSVPWNWEIRPTLNAAWIESEITQWHIQAPFAIKISNAMTSLIRKQNLRERTNRKRWMKKFQQNETLVYEIPLKSWHQSEL